ncbi:monooxygenase [Streptomyces mashuensis]|uniref:Monooxygenase n=1 Tax=Streptomyces mashuensis TaxID=33904 RepID=A0A919EAE5_9ACTN|nr:flavin reductase family protein [Streptomyces mashuensis]GHF29976.1 monooxygenase [Streptomyces mashuensis]
MSVAAARLRPAPRAGGTGPQSRKRRSRALAQLASPVSVLTVCHGGRLHGTTVSTVTAVSREPLLLGACLRAGSVFAELAVAEGRFVVNVLDAGQGELARWFADGSRPTGAEQFAGIAWEADPYASAPLIDGALAHYTCRVFDTPRVGDHDVLLGQVTRTAVHDGAPLLSYAGGLFAGPHRKGNQHDV